METYPAAVQREALIKFAHALGSASTALRRDECGDWRINGKRGHVYATPEGFQVYVITRSARAWGSAKKALAFARVTQDGDDEGMLSIDRLPTGFGEPEAIRHYAGILKKPDLTSEQVVAARERGLSLRRTGLGAGSS